MYLSMCIYKYEFIANRSFDGISCNFSSTTSIFVFDEVKRLRAEKTWQPYFIPTCYVHSTLLYDGVRLFVEQKF